MSTANSSEAKPIVTQKDIQDGLKTLNIKEGDVVLVHSSLSKVGIVENGADAVIDGRCTMFE